MYYRFVNRKNFICSKSLCLNDLRQKPPAVVGVKSYSTSTYVLKTSGTFYAPIPIIH